MKARELARRLIRLADEFGDMEVFYLGVVHNFNVKEIEPAWKSYLLTDGSKAEEDKPRVVSDEYGHE